MKRAVIITSQLSLYQTIPCAMSSSLITTSLTSHGCLAACGPVSAGEEAEDGEFGWFGLHGSGHLGGSNGAWGQTIID